MAIQSLQLQALDRFGDTLAGTIGLDDEFFDDAFTRAYRAVVNRVNMYNKDMLHYFAVETTTNDANGVSMDTLGTAFLTAVLRRYNDESLDYPCRKLHPHQFTLCTHDDSMYKAFKADPAFTIRDGKIYIKPDPTATDLGKIYAVAYPAVVDSGTETTLNGISSYTYPLDLEHAAIIWVQLACKWRATEYYRKLVQDQVDAISGSISTNRVTYTSVTTKTVTHNLGTEPNVDVLDSNGKIIYPIVTHSSVNEFVVTFPTTSTGTIIYSGFDYASGLLASFSAALPTFTQVSDVTLPTLTAPGDLAALTNSIPTYADMDLTKDPAGSAISIPSVLSDPTTGAPSLSALSATIDGISAANVTRIEKILEYAEDLLYKGAGSDTDTVYPSASADFTYNYKDDDSEMAQIAIGGVQAYKAIVDSEIQKALAEIGVVNADVQKIVGEYSSAVSAYNAKIQGLIGKYKTDIDRYIQAIRMVLEKYAQESDSDIKKFTAEFNYLATKYKAEADADIAEYSAKVQALLKEHDSYVQKEVAEFNSGMQKAKSYLEAAQVRLQMAYQTTASVQYINYEIQSLEREFDMEIRAFCGVRVSDDLEQPRIDRN